MSLVLIGCRCRCQGTIFSALLAVLGVAFIELNGALDPTMGDAVCMVAPIGVGADTAKMQQKTEFGLQMESNEET